MLEESVKNTIKKYNLIEKGDRIVLGVSGGPDSISMLNILYKLLSFFGRFLTRFSLVTSKNLI